jgi:hypothetical protein
MDARLGRGFSACLGAKYGENCALARPVLSNRLSAFVRQPERPKLDLKVS